MVDLLKRYESALRYLLPPIFAGGVALLSFMGLGETPLIRALGLAVVISAMSLTLRRLGALLSVIGGLTLAFSPAFWSQTGGDPSGTPVMALVLLGAMVAVLVLRRYGERGFLVIEIGVLIAAALFWRDFTYYRSLRITTLCAALLLYALMDGLLRTNPRPDEGPAAPLDRLHTMGVLLLLTIGTINEPLVILFAPAIVLALWLSHSRLPLWYWLFFAISVGIGGYGIITSYVSPQWWNTPIAQLGDLSAPYLIADGWREPSRWLLLIDLVVGQFNLVGIVLGVLGLARLARWYPPLGTTTVVVYIAYGLFGLMYLGSNKTVLLLPLLMVQMIWMTYAVYALRQWLAKGAARPILRLAVPLAFALLPLALLARILMHN